MVGLISPTLGGPRHILQRTSEFTKKSATGSLRAEPYAFSETIDHASQLRGRHAPSAHLSLRMFGFEDCESLFAHLGDKGAITER